MSVPLSPPLPDCSGEVLRLFPRLIAYARGLSCPEEDAPALVRDVALHFLDSHRPIRSTVDVEAALRREIGIRCLQIGPATDHGTENSASADYLGGIRLAQRELRRNFEALDRIDPDLRRIFVLRVINRMGTGEIAKALKMPLRQVKSHVERAMREVARIRRAAPVPGAAASLTSARPSVATPAGPRSKVPPARGGRLTDEQAHAKASAGKPPHLSLRLPAGRLRLVAGGKKWDGPGMH